MATYGKWSEYILSKKLTSSILKLLYNYKKIKTVATISER